MSALPGPRRRRRERSSRRRRRLPGCGGSRSGGAARPHPPWPRWPGEREEGDEPPTCSREPCPDLLPGRGGKEGGMEADPPPRPAPPPPPRPATAGAGTRRPVVPRRDPRGLRAGTPGCSGQGLGAAGAEQGAREAAAPEQAAVPGKVTEPWGQSLSPGNAHQALGTGTSPWGQPSNTWAGL